MSGTMQVWTLCFGAATIFLILVQVAILGGMLWGFQRFRATAKKFRHIMDAEGIEPHQFIANSYRALKTAEETAAKAAQAADSVNELITEARERIHRIETSVDHVKESIERTRENIQNSLSVPFHEYRAVSAAVRTALNVLRNH
jgi:hypothetical protein